MLLNFFKYLYNIINRIQNLNIHLRNMYLFYTVYIYYVYRNAHMHVYISEIYCLYIKYIYNINYMNINIDINTGKYFQNIYCTCVFIHT